MDPYPPSRSSKTPSPKQSFLRRTWRRAWFVAGGPVASIGINDISEGARFIDRLLRVLRSGPKTDPRLKTDAAGGLDLSATAFLYGISVEKLTERLRQRQAQTARAAYATFGFGVLSLGLWLYGALHMVLSSARIVSALEFLPFCALFFLLAFKSAWMNWQFRTRQLGSAGAFLRTTEPFLPR
jgi:hypothetical protein